MVVFYPALSRKLFVRVLEYSQQHFHFLFLSFRFRSYVHNIFPLRFHIFHLILLHYGSFLKLGTIWNWIGMEKQKEHRISQKFVNENENKLERIPSNLLQTFERSFNSSKLM